MELRGFTDEEEGILRLVNIGCCALSILAASFIVCATMRRGLQLPRDKLVFMLALSDIAYCGAMLFSPGVGKHHRLCTFQGLISTFAELYSVLWCVSIAWFMQEVMLGESSTDDDDELDPAEVYGSKVRNCFIFNTVVCAVAASVPFFGDHYKPAGPWCWIDDSTSGQMMRLLCFYLPLWLSFIVILRIYCHIIGYMGSPLLQNPNNTPGVSPSDPGVPEPKCCAIVFLLLCQRVDARHAALLRVTRHLMLYPVLLALSWGPASANRVQNYLYPESPQFWLYVTQLVCCDLNGLANAVAYTLSLDCAPVYECCPCCYDDALSVDNQDDFGPSSEENLYVKMQDDSTEACEPGRYSLARNSSYDTATSY